MDSPIRSEDSVIIQPEAHSTTHADEHGHPDLRMFGFTLFLVSESMLFVGLFVAYFAFRAVSPAWPPAGTPELETLLPAINTVILVSSSFVFYFAEVALIKRENINRFRLLLVITAAMGSIFLAGQVYEYTHLEFGLKDGLFGGTFYVLTGFHGLHVLVGVILQLIVLARSFKKGHYTPQRHFGVAASSLYWHFVDVIWIFLFLILYIL